MVGDSDSTSTVNENQSGADDSVLMTIFDKSLIAANKLVDSRVIRMRARYPDATPEQLVRKLETTFLSSVIAMGAATGGAAAVRGAGTAVVLTTAAGDTSWFLTASAGHVLSVLRFHGIDITDLEHQKAIVVMVLAGGGGGSTFTGKAAGRTGAHLGKLFTSAVPLNTIRSINRVVGPNFVTKWGTEQGILVLGKAIPFGVGMVIGAGGNLLFAKVVVTATRKAVSTALNVE